MRKDSQAGCQISSILIQAATKYTRICTTGAELKYWTKLDRSRNGQTGAKETLLPLRQLTVEQETQANTMHKLSTRTILEAPWTRNASNNKKENLVLF